MRLFIALDIDDAIRRRISTFLDGVRDFAPEARWVRPESLHVTLKFIGEKPIETAEAIKQALSAIRAEAVPIAFQGYGFFPTPKAPRVFWIGIQAESQLGRLAAAVELGKTRLRGGNLARGPVEVLRGDSPFSDIRCSEARPVRAILLSRGWIGASM